MFYFGEELVSFLCYSILNLFLTGCPSILGRVAGTGSFTNEV